ncbi:hypothetical protein ACLOJK_022452 [Asimina triloba]
MLQLTGSESSQAYPLLDPYVVKTKGRTTKRMKGPLEKSRKPYPTGLIEHAMLALRGLGFRKKNEVVEPTDSDYDTIFYGFAMLVVIESDTDYDTLIQVMAGSFGLHMACIWIPQVALLGSCQVSFRFLELRNGAVKVVVASQLPWFNPKSDIVVEPTYSDYGTVFYGFAITVIMVMAGGDVIICPFISQELLIAVMVLSAFPLHAVLLLEDLVNSMDGLILLHDACLHVPPQSRFLQSTYFFLQSAVSAR